MDATILLVCLSLGQASAPYNLTPPPDPSSNSPLPLGQPTPAAGPPAGSQDVPPRLAPAAVQAAPSPTLPASAQQPGSFAPPDRLLERDRLQDGAIQDGAFQGRFEALGQSESVPSATEETVVQATSQQPLSNATLAHSLLDYALQSPAERSAARPLSLRAAIEKVDNRASTVRAVKAYWQLSLALADHQHAVEEVEFLGDLPSPALAHEKARSTAVLAAAQARQVEAELALTAAQQDLVEAARVAGETSPVPSDLPFVGKYRTNFEALFANRTIPTGLRRINRTLPIMYRLIAARAEAVAAAGEQLKATTQAYQLGEAGFAELQAGFVQLRGQRIAFLAAVRDYNYSIADYALSVSTPDLDRDAIVSMLIEKKNENQSVLTPKRTEESESLPPTTGNASAAEASSRSSGASEFLPGRAEASEGPPRYQPPPSAQRPASGQFVPLRPR